MDCTASLDITPEGDALDRDIQESRAEVMRLISDQAKAQSHLEDTKNQMLSELKSLKEESWRLELYQQLEAMKQQLLQDIGTLGDSVDTETGLGSPRIAAFMKDSLAELQGGQATGAAAVKLEEGTCLEERERDLEEPKHGLEEGQEDLEADWEEQMASMMSQLEAARQEVGAALATKRQLEEEVKLSRLRLDDDDGIDANSNAGE